MLRHLFLCIAIYFDAFSTRSKSRIHPEIRHGTKTSFVASSDNSTKVYSPNTTKIIHKSPQNVYNKQK